MCRVKLWLVIHSTIHPKTKGVRTTANRHQPAVQLLAKHHPCLPVPPHPPRRVVASTQTLYMPSSNFLSPLLHPPSQEPHLLLTSSELEERRGSAENSTSLLWSTLANQSRRIHRHPGFAPVARRTSLAMLRFCFKPGAYLGFSLSRLWPLLTTEVISKTKCWSASRLPSVSTQVFST